MTWLVDQQQRRTFDPDTGNELFVEGSYSDGVTNFRISGGNVGLCFTGYLEALSESEKSDLKIEDAIVWNISSMGKLNDISKVLICKSLEKYQIAHGLNPRNDVVFVRFDRGDLFNA